MRQVSQVWWGRCSLVPTLFCDTLSRLDRLTCASEAALRRAIAFLLYCGTRGSPSAAKRFIAQD